MIRLLIWFLLLFIIYKTYRLVKKALATVDKSENSIRKKRNNSKYQIKDEDIIEAKFEDIIPKDNSKK
ncbi:hypothetical protein [Rosettibacter firmus]|uniref:hypothetical protein n=1 Tax=Rosettibacter firmus TaxID=3111522 RepID=UPI00336BBCEF